MSPWAACGTFCDVSAPGCDPRRRWRECALAVVHCEELANPYVLTLEGGVTRASYIGAAISGFR
jgi:hypothetical protein